jgi:trehalose 6-phosphate synthase
MPKRPRLIVVANRLPVHQVSAGGRGAKGGRGGTRWESSSGGLVTALAPILKKCDGTWVGWTGVAGKSTRPFRFEGLKIRPIPVSEREEDAYYNHISNRTLWPLYHDAIRTPEFDHHYWRPYIAVNERFARATAEVAKRGDVVWIHDYHLQLVPRMLRNLRPDLKIGFFLHIPFPPEELFAWLPWREQILNGMLGADVVGFQTHAAAQNFSRAAREYTEAEGTDQRLTLGDREIRVGSFPVSIDFDWFEQEALREETVAEAKEIRRRLGARTMLLSVDRLDYTKGIDLRMRAFEMLLKGRYATVNDCVLVQIATPSREQAFEYAEMRTRIEQLVGRINGEFSGPGRVAVHYFRRNLRREELAAYYRAADVMLVTPLRDGMNLVAKEYVATRTDNSGVLVLSEFAGAARQMKRALLVNPRDVEAMARTIHESMHLKPSDARQRMAILRTMVRRHDVYEWAEEFLGALHA